ncbi:MAG TPA: hypothetical protein PLP17_11715 [Oligoflexia bacterium]|nr:hypothetical protein [Oligoflexia bacterium]
MGKNLNYSRFNMWLSVAVAVGALAAVVYLTKPAKRAFDSPIPVSAKNADSTQKTLVPPSPDKPAQDSFQNLAPMVVPELSEKKHLNAEEPHPTIPPELQAQLEAEPPELPEEMKEQLRNPPRELPPDLKAQLEAPPPEIPEDIKRALQTPPRIVTLDEVNTPPSPQGGN